MFCPAGDVGRTPRFARLEETVMPSPSTRKTFRDVAVALGFLAVCAQSPPARADGTGWFTPDQVNQGRGPTRSGAEPATANLEGAGAPALRGAAFNAQWNGKTLHEFYSRAFADASARPERSGQDYVNVVAYILAQSGVPAGNQKLGVRSPMDRVLVLSTRRPHPAPHRPVRRRRRS
jgi:hypothetical protein